MDKGHPPPPQTKVEEEEMDVHDFQTNFEGKEIENLWQIKRRINLVEKIALASISQIILCLPSYAISNDSSPFSFFYYIILDISRF